MLRAATLSRASADLAKYGLPVDFLTPVFVPFTCHARRITSEFGVERLWRPRMPHR